MLSTAEVLEAVQRRAIGEAVAVHEEMKRGLNSLATITASAPFLGMFGVILGIVGSFHGVTGDRDSIMAALAGELAQSLIPLALSLLVAIPALWFYKYLTSGLEALDMEMKNAILELANHLALV